MEIAIEEHTGYRLAKITGELRADQGPRLTEDLHPLIAETGSVTIIDLSGMDWIDSGGLSQLIGLAAHARLSKSKIIFVSPTNFVAGVLEVTQLDRWFNMADSVEAAEQQLNG